MKKWTRRSVAGLTLSGVGAAAIAAQQTARRPREALPSAIDAGAMVVQDRATLAALDPKKHRMVFLDEGARSGWFALRPGQAPTDRLQGLAVPAAVSGYHWARMWDGVQGRPEWFGAVVDDVTRAVTNRAAIQACLDACPHTLLSGGVYHVDDTLVILRNGTRLSGVAHTQTDQAGNDGGSTSQISSTNPRATVLRVGAPSADRPRVLTETVTLADFTVNRSVGPFTPAQGIAGAIGIELRWIVNCHFLRVFSLNSSRGWLCYGTVENYLSYCGALRDLPGSNPANDVFIGFHLDYSAPAGFNGGNASLYIDRCRCYPLTERRTPALTASYGIYLDRGWVDLWIDGFEVGGGITWGIYGVGTGADAMDFRTENLFIRNCVFDPGGAGCIRLADAGPQTQIHITGNYLAPGSAATGLVLQQVHGNVTIADNQFIVGTAGTATGLSANGSEMVRLSGNSYVNLRQPIVFNSVLGFSIEDTIHSVHAGGDYPAIGLRGATGDGYVRCVVRGAARAYAAGVLVEKTVSRVEVNGSGMQPEATAPGGAVQHNGGPVPQPGRFGDRCVASGILA